MTAVIDSMGNCLFTSFALGAPEYADLLSAATGMKPEDDRLPKRLLQEPITNGPSKGMVSQIQLTLPQYYEARGWVNAFPTDETLRKLGLDECVGK